MMKQELGINLQFQKSTFPWKLMTPAYAVAYLLMTLLGKTYFWDDWYLYQTLSRREFRQYLADYGFPGLHGWVTLTLFQADPEIIRLFIFAAFFATGWCLFHILLTLDFLTPFQRSSITILFLVLPINSSRVALSVYIYTMSLFAFYLGWYLLVTKKSKLIQCFAIGSFILSFSTLSMLSFFVLPWLHRTYQLMATKTTKGYSFSSLAASLGLLVLPLTYWLIRWRSFGPTGERLEYQSPTLSGSVRGFILLIVCIAPIALQVRRKYRLKHVEGKTLLISIGIAVTAIGAFPYIASGRLVNASEWMLNFVPQASDWNSRHQLLLGLGFSVFITGVIYKIEDASQTRFLAGIVGFCIILNLTYMQGYYLDSLKQKQIMSALSNSAGLVDAHIIMINDKTEVFNARGREYRPYEWDGMLNSAIGGSVKTGVGSSYIDCNLPDEKIPDTFLTISASSGKLKATFTGDLGIVLSIARIRPCK